MRRYSGWSNTAILKHLERRGHRQSRRLDRKTVLRSKEEIICAAYIHTKTIDSKPHMRKIVPAHSKVILHSKYRWVLDPGP
jgi:hypothetical protein